MEEPTDEMDRKVELDQEEQIDDEVDVVKETDVLVDPEIEQLKKEVLAKLIKQSEEESRGRAPYIMPKNRFIRTFCPIKVITVGNGLGFSLSRDIVNCMGLRKGDVVNLEIKLGPLQGAEWLNVSIEETLRILNDP